jgi:exonuclease III
MTRSWNILDWNIRGINSQEIWDDIRQRINESNCNIMCFQETKREHFDLAYLKNFCPRRFNQFAYAPSMVVLGVLSLYGMATTLMAL